MAMMLTDLANVCRAAGLKVIETPGWKTRGHGPMTDVRTIVCHHTAGPATGNMPSLNVVTSGRSDLAGPLCHLGLARDGTVYVVAAGLAYHAGAVRDPSYGNAHAIGIEAEGTGRDSWPQVQMDAYARLCRALCDHSVLSVSRVLGHKEVCAPIGRKTDPNFDMAALRQQITNLEDDMAVSDDDVKRIGDYVMKRFGIADPDDKVNRSLAGSVTELERDVIELKALVGQVLAEVKAR